MQLLWWEPLSMVWKLENWLSWEHKKTTSKNLYPIYRLYYKKQRKMFVCIIFMHSIQLWCHTTTKNVYSILETPGSHPKSSPSFILQLSDHPTTFLIFQILTKTDTFMFDNYPFIYLWYKRLFYVHFQVWTRWSSEQKVAIWAAISHWNVWIGQFGPNITGLYSC